MARTDPQINVRLPLLLKEQLEARAAANHRSFKAEIVARLEDSLVREEEDLVFHMETAEVLKRPRPNALRDHLLADPSRSATRETGQVGPPTDLDHVFRKVLWLEHGQNALADDIAEILRILASKS